MNIGIPALAASGVFSGGTLAAPADMSKGGDGRYVLLIPGTSSIAHLHENLAAAELALTDTTLAELGTIDGEGLQRAP